MASREKQFLIARWENRRDALKALVLRAEPHQNREIFPGWKLKDFLAHMSGWDESVIESMDAHKDGKPYPTPASGGVNAYNAQSVSSRENLDYDQIFRDWNRTHERIFQALRDMPDEKFVQPITFPWGETGSIAYLVEIFVEHEEEHAEHLQRWLENPMHVIPQAH